jgi:hypothetical protein
VFIIHCLLVSQHFEKSFCGTKLGFFLWSYDRIWFQNYLKRPTAAMLELLQQDEDVYVGFQLLDISKARKGADIE